MDDFIEKSIAAMGEMQIVKRGLLASLLTGELRVRTDTEAA